MKALKANASGFFSRSVSDYMKVRPQKSHDRFLNRAGFLRTSFGWSSQEEKSDLQTEACRELD